MQIMYAPQGLSWKLRHNVVLRQVAMCIGVDAYMHTDDRRLLERVILPHVAGRSDFARILFVGCDWYTRGYARFFEQREFWTMDVDPAKRRYGSDRHIADCVSRVDRHFGRGALDAVVCNGVFGWGLDERNAVERTFWAFRRVMRRGALFILGWNDVPTLTPFPLEECRSLALYAPYEFPPLRASRFMTTTPNRHTYAFYSR